MLDFLGLLLNVLVTVGDVLMLASAFQALLRRLLAALVGEDRRVSLFWSVLAVMLLGLLAGGISLAVLPSPVAAPYPVRGGSLILAPAISALVLMLIGDVWHKWRGWRPALFTFRAGAVFAFGIALVRFVNAAH